MSESYCMILSTEGQSETKIDGHNSVELIPRGV